MPETSSDEQVQVPQQAKLGGARSDFRSSLGKKVSELRASLRALDQDPSSARLRDDLRRRVHALSGGARLLRLHALGVELVAAEKVLERSATVGSVDPGDLRRLAAIVESVPTLAWSEPEEDRPSAARDVPSAVAEKRSLPPIILVVGAAGLADAILHPSDQRDDGEMECERSPAVEGALEMTRAIAPDVVVVDADLPGALELVDRLARDPLTEPVPVVAVGTWGAPDEAARWIAAGCSRALPKPVSPFGLREACQQIRGGDGAIPRQNAFGLATVDELTERVVEEVSRGLRGALAQGQAVKVPFEDGTDVLAAVWGAVARIRDLVVLRSEGAVRFHAAGPEGGLPIAPWWGDNSGSSKRGGASLEGELRLDGRIVVVADDDPAVTWFVGGVLRAAGATVHEARDGQRALEVCFLTSPDLVISDVLMPRLDGFALCRALKRDIALRDVPVILLSWKEDLLQRLRDLGADADGYLRKEASAGAILQRVYEVMRTRTRIEARLQGDAEVRGRLDGLTPRTLLATTARLRRNARIAIRDASFLYEVEMREGAPKSATRTTSDGSFERGKEVFAALLGVRAGRFVVTSATGTARGTLQGDLAEQLELPISHARAGLSLLTGAKLLEVHRVEVAIDRVLPYLSATPEPARSLITRLANGASPRALILTGEVASALLDDVLADLAAHGAIVGVQGEGSVDLLGAELQASLAARRRAAPSDVPEDSVQLLVVQRHTERHPAAPLGSPALAPAANSAAGVPPRPTSSGLALQARAAEANVARPNPNAAERSLIGVAFNLEDEDTETPRGLGSPEGASASDLADDEWEFGAHAPSSLEAAVMREISDRTPLPGPLPAAPARVPTIVDATALKSRMPPPSGPASLAPATASVSHRTPALERISSPPPESAVAPDAVVPGNGSEERVSGSEVAALTSASPGVDGPSPPVAASGGEPARPRLASGTLVDAVPAPPQRRAFPLVATAVVTASLLAVGIYVARDPLVPAPPFPAPSASESTPAAPATSAAAASATTSGASITRGMAPGDSPLAADEPLGSALPPGTASAAAEPAIATVGEDLPLPPGVPMNAYQGMLDIETGGREAIFVDGGELGRGPVLRLMLSPGVHEVRVRARAEERIRFVMVRTSRRTKLSLVSPWTR